MFFKQTITRYRKNNMATSAWLYTLFMEGANRNNCFLYSVISNHIFVCKYDYLNIEKPST
ncbi:hypothetical protein DXD29_04420 [Bifidobacterium pseudocatenulatum]|nr:hypothetical protein DXD75_01205 [Bifidobacterium pseudocatenulatum]RGK16372.1 hypothetical protein DXD29_04420 [Bifidobacterium pseudocatenulatum]RGW59382.1 hypothetical protein DWV61_07095 [Bifidobacterium pseudocatenulatum]RHJ80850.1 hypothetical protein DW102_04515 [Bifidobacterium pseudocatenulatum]RHJ85019.1 hypothetical protein DW101_04790 [Bifidobacterium pseudocatenulatum]